MRRGRLGAHISPPNIQGSSISCDSDGDYVPDGHVHVSNRARMNSHDAWEGIADDRTIETCDGFCVDHGDGDDVDVCKRINVRSSMANQQIRRNLGPKN